MSKDTMDKLVLWASLIAWLAFGVILIATRNGPY